MGVIMSEKPTDEFKFHSALLKLSNDVKGMTDERLSRLAYALENVDNLPLPIVGEAPPVSIKEQLPLLPIDFIKDCYHRMELGDADMLQKLYNGRVVYDNSAKKWHTWNGVHWEADKNLIKYLYSAQVAEQYLMSAMALRKEYETNKLKFAKIHDADGKVDKDEIDRNDEKLVLFECFIKRSKSLRTLNRTKRALEFMHGVMGVQGEIWDNNPLLLGVKNGTVDLKTTEFKGGEPSDYIKTVANVDFDRHARCPRFEKFMLEIFGNDAEVARFMQRLIGYSITGLTTEHIFPILWGEDGRNGKSTLLLVIKDVLGNHIKSIHSDVVVDNGRRGGANPFLMELKGRRIVYASEPENQVKLKEATIKSITGGDIIVGRGLYEKPQEWQPTHTMFLITNPKPVMSVTDDALWERIILIPFIHRFVDNPQGEFEHQRDTQLIEKLQEEKAGILNWLIAGCLEWQRAGLQVPETVKSATDKYHQEADNFPDFIEENCILGNNCFATVSEMWARYENYSYNENNKLKRKEFNERMNRMGIHSKVDKVHQSAVRRWQNIGLLSV